MNSTFQNGKFVFNLDIYANVALIEKTNPNLIKGYYDNKKNINNLKSAIQKEINNNLQNMLYEIQQNKIDPIGLSLYAKAFQYKEWKKVKGDWSQALAEAKINVKTHVKIKDTGTIRN
ncbi:Spore germination protein B3 precursor [Streptococcus pneumoniae]|nr:Spore germination protein B3 precursor [Streptococcus pneumoniae]